MKKRKFKNLLIIGILILGISLITNCENNDNSILENDSIDNVTDSIPTNIGIKFIQSSELPDAFKEALFNNFPQQKNATSKQKQKLLESYFEPEASVVTSNNGIITYALPIKNSKYFKSSLKKGAFQQKLSKSSFCDDEAPFEVLAMNFNGSDIGGANNGLTHIAFTSGVNPGTIYTTFTNSNTGIQETIPTFLQEHINSINESFNNSTPTGNGSIVPIFTGIWRGISWAGQGLINLFRGDKCHCPNNSGSKNSNQQKNQTSSWDDVDSCCSSSFGSKNNSKKGDISGSNKVNFQFYIPLPDSLFEDATISSKNKSGKSQGKETDCECKFEKIDIETASELIKQDLFDCACANDNAVNMAPLLKLNLEQISWLAKPENKTIREAICKFTKDNNYSEEAEAFGKSAVEALMDGGEVDFKNEIIKDKSFIGTKADCVLNALIASGNNLFKKTSQAFTDGKSKFKLRFTTYNNLNDQADARTGFPASGDVITIRFNLAQMKNSPAMDLARSIFHESIHAELHRIKLEGNIGPNPLPTSLHNWYLQIWSYYQAINNDKFDDPYKVLNKTATDAQHNLMAFRYIKPIASGLREFDENTHPLDNYRHEAWTGLDNYGKTAGYITKEKLDDLAKLYEIVRDDSHKNPCD